jgi:PhoH-like ATPase
MANTYVLDTSVLLSAGRTALYSFGANNVVLPLVVVRELETKRNDPDLGLAARSVLRALEALLSQGDLREGVSLGEGYGSLKIETNHVQDVPEALRSYPSNDTRIVTVALNLSNEADLDDTVYLVTKDIPLKLMASIVGVKTENFTPQNISGDYIDNTEVVWVDAEVINEVHENETVRLDLDIPRNVGVLLRSNENPKHTALVISGKQYEFNLIKDYEVSGLESRSAEQAFAIDYLMDESVKIVSLGGRAGTGKTTLALAAGVEQFNKGIYKKIIVFRSMHAVGGEELGFLPGTEAEKMDPWTAAIYDSLGSFLTKEQIGKLKTKQAIEVLPLTHIRGRTFNNAFIIIDESQNLERATILTALSRLGKNSKAVMTWDVSQRDNFRVGRHDGVYEVASRLLGEKLFAHTSLKKSERSDVAELVSRVLDDFDMK